MTDISPSEINLGDIAHDRITGTTGTVTQICFNLDGTSQMLLEYFNHTKGEACRDWFDSARIVEGGFTPKP